MSFTTLENVKSDMNILLVKIKVKKFKSSRR